MSLKPATMSFAIAAIASLFTAETLFAQSDDLLKMVPRAANAIVVIDADGLMQSPLAVKENWMESREKSYVERGVFVPPEASRVVLAAELDAANHLETDWELALMKMKESFSMKEIARAEGGTIQTIDSLVTVATPTDAFFVQMAEDVLGMMYPANRQYVSRWAAFHKQNDEIVISPYLKNAADSVPASGQVAMAIDLKHVPDPVRLRVRLEQSETLSGKDVDLDKLTDVLTTIQGVTLNLNVSQKRTGQLRVDFGTEVSILEPFAKELLLEALANNGAMIDDFKDWRVQVSADSVHMFGELSKDGMRRIFSILEMPTSRFKTHIDEESPSDPGQTIIKASKAYFSSITTLIEDLRKTLGKTRDNHAVWMERYARKIDRLPILHVDPDLLAFGSDVAESFRNMALAVRASGIRGGVRRANAFGSGGGGGYSRGTYARYNYNGIYYAGYGAGSTIANNTQAARNNLKREQNASIRIRTQERAKAKEVRYTEWQALENGLADIRVKMTQRYNVEFVDATTS